MKMGCAMVPIFNAIMLVHFHLKIIFKTYFFKSDENERIHQLWVQKVQGKTFL